MLREGMDGASAAFPSAMTQPLTIAVLGTGNIGGTLGRAFAAAGHAVVLGSRHPSDGADPHEVPVAEALSTPLPSPGRSSSTPPTTWAAADRPTTTTS
jgi:hypothetical protein